MKSDIQSTKEYPIYKRLFVSEDIVVKKTFCAFDGFEYKSLKKHKHLIRISVPYSFKQFCFLI